MAKWILTGRAELDGTCRDPGYVFDRPDDWTPPMSAERTGAAGTMNEFTDKPIAERVPEKPPELDATRS